MDDLVRGGSVLMAAISPIDSVNMQSLCQCSLWKISRIDGVKEYFTNWDEDLFVVSPDTQDNIFRSSVGIGLSSTSREIGMRSQSQSAVGIIDGIDADLLRGGVYDSAQIDEWRVDARWPSIRGMEQNRYWITNIDHTTEVWAIEMEGYGRKLKETTGVPFNRSCRYYLGGPGCSQNRAAKNGINILDKTYGSLALPLTVTEVDSLNVFRVSTTVGTPSIIRTKTTFPHGRVQMLTGKNAGMAYETFQYVADFSQPNQTGKFFLLKDTVVPIKVGDECIIEEGCDGAESTCINEFDNILNFGGNQFIPGAQKARQVAKIDWTR
jgi:uncharacterized phage protein (TIGR02218 family)